MAKTFTPGEIAAELGCSPKALRAYIRSGRWNESAEGIRVGKGHRHAITAADMRAIKKGWAARTAAASPQAKAESKANPVAEFMAANDPGDVPAD